MGYKSDRSRLVRGSMRNKEQYLRHLREYPPIMQIIFITYTKIRLMSGHKYECVAPSWII